MRIGKFFIWILFGLSCSIIQAQENYLDYYPSYKTWNTHYQIDKIEFKDSSTIIYFRFAKENKKETSYTFYAPKSKKAFLLENSRNEKFLLKAIKNIQINGITKIDELKTESKELTAFVENEATYTFFACELHFERLPEGMPKVSLIEGEGFLYNKDKLNCLDIRLNEKAGTPVIASKRIEIFESNCLTKKSESYPERIVAPRMIGEDIDMKLFEGALFIDEEPSYKVPDYYNLKDQIYKIIYTKTETIFFLRFYANTRGIRHINIYNTLNENAWYLKNMNGKERYSLKAVTQIRVNDQLKHEILDEKEYRIVYNKYGVTKVTCLVHFDRLPNKVKKVNLIEGDQQKVIDKKTKSRRRYFNFQNVKMQVP
ncbi:MAG: hypothetical protein GY810_11935 [Aureispira sp.]|nr:hypothetical protein [Aureispira sp.]